MEPLETLRSAVLAMTTQLGAQHGPVRIDQGLGAVVVDDVQDGTARAALVAAIRKCRLNVEAPGDQVRVFGTD